MVKAPIDNLGKRQRALNERVNEAASNKLNFDIVKDEQETSEVDKLYKIDLAAKYKNVDYILDILKTGDGLYTSRALKKCVWLFSDEYSYIMNPEYLQKNIFPFTSNKMKRKIVKTAAVHVNQPDRALEFYQYCVKENIKSTNFTFLLYTTDDFKLDQLINNKDPSFKKLETKDILYYRLFVGKSFILLDALLNFISINWKRTQTARMFKFMYYSESEEKYLDIAEKHVSTYFGFQTDKFDPKLSDSIMKKHKDRVLTNPKFYVNTVNTNVLVRNSTIDDAKLYAKVLLPDNVSEFWMRFNYTIFRSVFEIIPHDKTYEFFKDFFAQNYQGAEFEMHKGFYHQEYYRFMTFEQREEWAFRQLKSEKQVLGVGNDYLWYRFIKFEAAFDEIKRLISITKDADKRNAMTPVLIMSARNDRELETLFKYYKKRHMNELRKHNEEFLKKVVEQHNVFEFDDECWSAFYAIVLALEYTNEVDGKKTDNNYKNIAVVYHILHEKVMPDGLLKFFLDEFSVRSIDSDYYLKNITDEKEQLLHEYFFNFYMDNIEKFKNEKAPRTVLSKEITPRCRRYFDNVKTSMRMFNEDGEVYENTNINKGKKTRYICTHHITSRSLLRDLKKDKELVIQKLPVAQRNFEGHTHKIDTFLKKIRVYFPNDVTTMYLNMFHKIILNQKLVYDNIHRMEGNVIQAVANGVYAIFQLADEKDKIDFMIKYFSENTKIDRKTLDIEHLRIQRAICRYSCTSRPPVPLSNMAMYIKGDCVKYCLNIFNTYLAHLPLPMCQHFVSLVLDKPVSIQKHAIRLAFQCFNADDMKKNMLTIWKNTKNVSLRAVIYKDFFTKFVDTQEKDFYDILKTLTLEMNQDDEEVVFDLTVSNKIPADFIGDYIEAVWNTVNKFKDVEPNITLKKKILSHMITNLNQMNEEFMTVVVYEHINTMILENKVKITYSREDIADLYERKWCLTAHYIIRYFFSGCPPEKYVQLSQYIFRKNIESWNEIAYGINVRQKCSWNFLYHLRKTSLQQLYGKFEMTIPIFQGISEIIDSDLQFPHNYMLTWELQLIMLSGTVTRNNRKIFEESSHLEAITESIKEFSEGVGKLVTHYVGINNYFMSYSKQVRDKINNCMKDLLNMFDASQYLNNVLISLAAGLTEFELAETYVLAIQLLPTNREECSSDNYKCLINKLQGFRNNEVQLHLYQSINYRL